MDEVADLGAWGKGDVFTTQVVWSKRGMGEGGVAMIPAPQPNKCKTCRVNWKRCDLRLQDCKKIFPISDMELELILQINENLPTDELEIVVRDLIVMDIRERQSKDDPRSRPHTPAPERKTYEKCLHHFSCPNGEECWYFSQDYYWDCGEGATRLAKERATIRNATLDDVRKALSHIRFQEEDLWFVEAAQKKIESLRGDQ